jgi:hypothetical protein
MEESTSLSSATNRLERRDSTLTSIDIRGAFGSRARRSTVRRFVAALKRCSSSSSLQRSIHFPSQQQEYNSTATAFPWCCLRHLSLHNRLLEKSELPHLFGALPHVPTLEVLVLFNHDVGDDGTVMLMEALVGNATIVDVDGNTHDHIMDTSLDSLGFANLSMTMKTKHPTPNNNTTHIRGLRELYLSHCGIGCRGAQAIATAISNSYPTSCDIDGDDGKEKKHGYDDDVNKLKCLQVLSLGSNLIEWEGAMSLATAFGKYPPLQRLVLHGNKGISANRYPRMGHSTANEYQLEERYQRERMMIRQVFHPVGWESLRLPSSTTTLQQMTATIPPQEISKYTMSEIFVPLILRYVQRRWEQDRVLVRSHDTLRTRLRDVMMTNEGGQYTKYIDEHINYLPDMLSYLGRVGVCYRHTSMHNNIDLWIREKTNPIQHSSGWEPCQACRIIHLGDLYELFKHLPHLVAKHVEMERANGVYSR